MLTILADLTVPAAVSLGVSVSAAASIPFWLFVDADLADFDPRPAVRRALETGRIRPAWQVAVDTGHDLNRAIATGQRVGRRTALDAAVTAAALLALLFPASEATR